MLRYQEKLQSIPKAKTQFEETEQPSEPDIAEMLELPAQEFKMLRALIDKVDMKEQMNNISRKMKS